MFKRRKLSYTKAAAEWVYPRGGWWRSLSYMVHRIRRLPDPPHRISRGVFAGVVVCFTPLFGLHILLAMLIAWIIRGNLFAAVLATFVGNPLTFPIIAQISVALGEWMLGIDGHMSLHQIFGAFSHASAELWRNFWAIFTPAVAEWGSLLSFFDRVFLPYLVGGLIPGLICGLAFYALSRPVISAYQKGRIKRMKKRYEKRVAAQKAVAQGDRDGSGRTQGPT